MHFYKLLFFTSVMKSSEILLMLKSHLYVYLIYFSDGFEDNDSKKNDGYMNANEKSRWSVVCDTIEEWVSLAEKFKTSKSKNESSLFKVIQENFLPTLSQIYEEKVSFRNSCILFILLFYKIVKFVSIMFRTMHDQVCFIWHVHVIFK